MTETVICERGLGPFPRAAPVQQNTLSNTRYNFWPSANGHKEVDGAEVADGPKGVRGELKGVRCSGSKSYAEELCPRKKLDRKLNILLGLLS